MSLNKICLHWTGGNNYPCETDLNAYHYCVDKDGRIYQGKFKPEDNINCKDGKYAKHCGGNNTGCIGISLCGMRGFNSKNKETDRPITEKQVEAFCCLAAYLSVKYGISISEETIFTHYEFDKKQANPNLDFCSTPSSSSLSFANRKTAAHNFGATSCSLPVADSALRKNRKGKTDITYISYLPNLSIEKVGGYLRNKITWYKIKIRENKYTFEKKGNHYEFTCSC